MNTNRTSKVMTVFRCKYCGMGFQKAEDLIAHKKENHLLEIIASKKLNLTLTPTTPNAVTDAASPTKKGEPKFEIKQEFITEVKPIQSAHVTSAGRITCSINPFTVEISTQGIEKSELRSHGPVTGQSNGLADACHDGGSVDNSNEQNRELDVSSFPEEKYTHEDNEGSRSTRKSDSFTPAPVHQRVSHPLASYLKTMKRVVIPLKALTPEQLSISRSLTKLGKIKSSDRVLGLTRHYYKSAEHMLTRRRNFPCPKCAWANSTISNLSRHIRLIHSSENPESIIESLELRKISTKVKSSVSRHRLRKTLNRFKCSYCSQTFNYRSLRKRHEGTHTRPYSCKICSQTFATNYQYNSHVRKRSCVQNGNSISTNSSEKCQVCLKSTVGNGMANHMLTKHPHCRLYKCTDSNCSYTSKTESNMNIHLKIHQIQSQYKCFNCTASFRSKSNRKMHIRKFHLQKPQTKLNGKELRRRSATIHPLGWYYRNLEEDSTEETTTNNPIKTKPYSCRFCKKIFKNKSVLKSHKFTHKRLADCPHCPYRATSKSHLLSHLRIHECKDDNRIFKCPDCSGSFAKEFKLTIHRESIHGWKHSNTSSLPEKSSVCSPVERDAHLTQHDFKCNQCSASFNTKIQLTCHWKWHSSSSTSNKLYRKLDYIGSDGKNTDRGRQKMLPKPQFIPVAANNFLCSFTPCPFSGQRAYLIREHEKKVHLVQHEHKCNQCSASFINLHSLSCHTKWHDAEAFSSSGKDQTNENKKKIDKAIDGSMDRKNKKINYNDSSDESAKSDCEKSIGDNSHELECFECGTICKNIIALKQHNAYHHSDTAKKLLNSNQKLLNLDKKPHKHMAYKLKKKIFPLSRGTKVTPKTVKPSSLLNSYFCKYCPFSASSQGRVDGHQTEAHLTSHKFKCLRCSASYRTARRLSFHMRWHASEALTFVEKSASSDSAQTSQKQQISDEEKKLECFECDEVMLNKSSFIRHISNHERKSMKLSKSVPTPATGSSKHPYIFACSHCPYTSIVKIRLKEHEFNVHEQKNEFECPLCTASYSLIYNLQRHMTLHKENGDSQKEGEMRALRKRRRPSKPEDESREFDGMPKLEPIRSNLPTRVTLPSMNKEVAGKRRMTYQEYDRMTFRCKVCETSFSRECDLTRHMSCDYHLQNEVLVKDKLKPIKGGYRKRGSRCKLCERIYPNRSQLLNHLKRIHDQQNTSDVAKNETRTQGVDTTHEKSESESFSDETEEFVEERWNNETVSVNHERTNQLSNTTSAAYTDASDEGDSMVTVTHQNNYGLKITTVRFGN